MAQQLRALVVLAGDHGGNCVPGTPSLFSPPRASGTLYLRTSMDKDAEPLPRPPLVPCCQHKLCRVLETGKLKDRKCGDSKPASRIESQGKKSVTLSQ